ncbi:saccharopine dehydrogenase family protein [Streptomyces sp. NPDC056452]|uniref:saccharopine dehydrogenase family protein n=1 Tax=Streptomyces sp. NPDC056452 TaxID=3345821 RepID=UPI00368F32F5
MAAADRALPGPEFDLILWGATGHAGRFAAEALASRPGLRWAIGGRDEAALHALREELGAPAGNAVIVADARDTAAMRALAGRAGVVLSAVGPYRLYGSPLVEACAMTGTDYVDLNGEPLWMRRMIDRFQEQARLSGARIVFSCGFDSLPMETGVQVLQDAALRRWGVPLPRVDCRIEFIRSEGFSPGTVASLRDSAAAAAASGQPDAEGPFLLAPGFRGPAHTPAVRPRFDGELELWTAPWAMAGVNTRVLHRSNALRDHAWGTDFVYDETVIAGPGPDGRAAARSLARALGGTADGVGTVTAGADRNHPEAAYRLSLTGHAGDRRLYATVAGTGDPGYRSAARMAVGVADCLVDGRPGPNGGMWTPGALLGDALTERLVAAADMTFTVSPPGADGTWHRSGRPGGTTDAAR